MYVYVGLHSTVEFAAKGLELAKSTAGFDYTKFTLGLPFYGRYGRTTPYLYVLTYLHTYIYIHSHTYIYDHRHVQTMEPKTFYEISDLITMQRKAGNSEAIQVSLSVFYFR